MFISDTHLPQVLSPEHYTSQEQYDREMQRFFLPGWHFVGALDDIPNDGDYLTYDLFGYPLIIWRQASEVHTFLNVCAHRFCTLRDDACGHMDHLHCQYHGWEYSADGNTRRIPDAKSFKPMEKGKLGLTKFRTELAGQLIYVNLSESGPDLKEYLGAGYDVACRIFSNDRRLFMSFDYEIDANWKVKVENTLESYHIDLIHPTTFGAAPDEAICKHELNPRFTTFETTDPGPSAMNQWMNKLAHRMARTPYVQTYKHHLYYPSIMMMHTGLVSVAESVFPLGPNKSTVRMKFFAYCGDPERFLSRLLLRGMKRYGREFFEKVAREDAGIMPSIQRGLQARRHPSEGLISVREERLFHFQEFILQATADDPPREHHKESFYSEPVSADA